MNNNSKFILGISAYYHDSAAAIIDTDGNIIAAAQEERFTRIKHDSSFPENAVKYCLHAAGIEPPDLQAVSWYEKPFVKFERILETTLANIPASLGLFMRSMPTWVGDKLLIRKQLQKHFPNVRQIFTKHHEAHAASAFYPSPFHDAAIICLDGVGEWDTTTYWVGHDNKIIHKKSIEFPHSLGLLYSTITGYLGFRVNSGEYKVMGLAPYGRPKYSKIILDNLIDVKDDGSFWLNQKYFNFMSGERMYNESEMDRLLGRQPRNPESDLTQDDMDLARSLQDVTENIILKIARHVRKETGQKNLCLAGGTALNCVANGKILAEGIFDGIWIQPAAGDAGGALGAALTANYMAFDGVRNVKDNDSMHGALLGPEYSVHEIKMSLSKYGAPYKEVSEKDLPKLIANYIADGSVVGRFAGRAEFGPRALGNRSIIADPRNQEMQKKLNIAIKKRESFRPFAPTCLEEDIHELFDIKAPSPYMLLTGNVSESLRMPVSKDLYGMDLLYEHRSALQAITHVDYSARIQSISRDNNPKYWEIINEFKKISGFGCVVNTSFNVRGEPLVGSPDDAYKCFINTDMDVLVIENLVLIKSDQPNIKFDSSYKLD